MAIMVLGDLKFVPRQEPFRWEVSMVEPPKPEPVAEQAPTSAKPTPVKPTPVPVTPTEVAPIVETVVTQVVQAVQPVQRVETQEIRQEAREVRPVEQVVERTAQTVTRSAEAVAPAPPTPQVIAPSAAVSTAAPVVETARAEAVVQAGQPVAGPAPVVAATAGQPVIQAAPSAEAPVQRVADAKAVVQAGEVMTASVAKVMATRLIETATATVREREEPKFIAAPPLTGATETSRQPVREAALRPAPAVSRSAAQADYRWVGEALGERVRQLLTYPAKARLNNLTGRVIVKVVIREDGHLYDVEVVKGSGHEILDEAAVDLVRRSCPLKMKHALGRPRVTIMLPVTYELIG
jgi:protein TonB